MKSAVSSESYGSVSSDCAREIWLDPFWASLGSPAHSRFIEDMASQMHAQAYCLSVADRLGKGPVPSI